MTHHTSEQPRHRDPRRGSIGNLGNAMSLRLVSDNIDWDKLRAAGPQDPTDDTLCGKLQRLCGVP
jgi:hypothetical protein